MADAEDYTTLPLTCKIAWLTEEELIPLEAYVDEMFRQVIVERMEEEDLYEEEHGR